VYWSNGERCLEAAVGNLAVTSYLYSKADPERAEKSFHEMESDYPPIVDKILAGQDLRKQEYFGLITMLFDLHLRNPAYKNRAKAEHFDVYQAISKSFNADLFADEPQQGRDLRELTRILTEFWVVQPIRVTNDRLITSDHPALLFSHLDRLAFGFLPIHPLCGVLVADTRRARPQSATTSLTDVALLNTYQVRTCIRHVYADHDLSGDIGDDKPLTKWLRKQHSRGFADLGSWQPELIKYPGDAPNQLSFVNLIKC